MVELKKEHPGPVGDPARHVSIERLEEAFKALPEAPTDQGILRLIVVRRADGVRETPDEAVLSVDEGLQGDGWSRRPPRKPLAQLAIMRHDLATIIGNGQRLSLFGDNLLVDLDLSVANLPFGTRLRVGEALVEMTPEPHTGCKKFRQRFGLEALVWIGEKHAPGQNRRGIYWRVVEPGRVRVGDPIQVIERPDIA